MTEIIVKDIGKFLRVQFLFNEAFMYYLNHDFKMALEHFKKVC